MGWTIRTNSDNMKFIPFGWTFSWDKDIWWVV